jgi:ABC-type glycerol-3-phosphate transport system permease component
MVRSVKDAAILYAALQGSGQLDAAFFLSGGFAILPPFLRALWFQRWIVNGVTSGGVKG